MGNIKRGITTKQSNYNEAIKKVEDNIHRIYDDAIIKEVMADIRHRLKIDGSLYEKFKNVEDKMEKKDKIDNIHRLMRFFTDMWVGLSFQDEEFKKIFTKQIVKNRIYQGQFYNQTNNKTDTEISEAEIEQIASNVSEKEADVYLRREIDLYMLSGSFLRFPVRVNLNIWKSVVDAMLFNIPEEKVLEFKQSIMEKDYLPTIKMDKGFLFISINELTTQNDLTLAWDSFKKIRDEYKNKYNYLYSERGCKDVTLDRILFDLNYNRGLGPKAIYKELPDERKIGLNPDKISERLKEIRKRTRINKLDKWLLTYG